MVNLTQFVLFAAIALLFVISCYMEFYIPRKKGKTLLAIKLKQRHYLDGLIFIGLVMLLFYHYGRNGGVLMTGYLLTFLFILSVYFYFIRSPKLILKGTGFFYGCIFIDYDRIAEMQLNEKGVLFFHLEKKTLDIHVKTMEDLEHIYHTLANLSYSQPPSLLKK